MSNEATKEAEENESKETITVAEKNSGGTASADKETITVAEKAGNPS
ncbi:MAG: hypothetical protein ABIU09_05910 [Pyrinomonadaceae bacterium]